jgi:hypothetical protein
MSIREIALALSVSPGTVRHWLRKHELRTRPRRYSLRGAPKPESIARECALHGWTTFVRIGAGATAVGAATPNPSPLAAGGSRRSSWLKPAAVA